MKNENITVLLDVDGVLCNFVEKLCDFYGIDCEDAMQNWEPLEEYELHKTEHFKAKNITEEKIKNDLLSMPFGWWRSMNTYPHFSDILILVDDYFKNWLFATSPIMTGECLSGRLGWLNWIYGGDLDETKVMIGHSKFLMANKNTLLIDDSEKNVKKFISMGGQAILYPRPWNSNWIFGFGNTYQNWDESKAFKYFSSELFKIIKQ